MEFTFGDRLGLELGVGDGRGEGFGDLRLIAAS